MFIPLVLDIHGIHSLIPTIRFDEGFMMDL